MVLDSSFNPFSQVNELHSTSAKSLPDTDLQSSLRRLSAKIMQKASYCRSAVGLFCIILCNVIKSIMSHTVCALGGFSAKTPVCDFIKYPKPIYIQFIIELQICHPEYSVL